MPLAPYTESYWYPTGAPAIGQLLYVFPRFSNVLADLFTDDTGTVPVSNPVVLDAAGTASFWTENGDYWGYVNGQSFYLIIDLDPNLTHVWPATFQWDQTTPAAMWVIPHGQMTKPAVTCLDTNSQLIFGDVQYLDDNTLTIDFGTPVAGTAYLRR